MSANPAEAVEPLELFIVFNPGSGSQDKDEARQAIAEALDRAGRRYRFLPVEGGDVRKACADAARLAQESDGAIVAVGGDGTINTAAQAAYAQECVLGVIAQGTFNMFAREHGLALDIAQATDDLLRSRAQAVQAGSINQRLFLVNAALGLYPQVLKDREEMKARFGRRRWVAFAAALMSLADWRKRLALEIELDGETMRIVTPSLFVCNNRLQLERVGIDPQVCEIVGQGWLGGIASRRLGAWSKLRLVVDALVGRLGAAPEVTALALRSLTVSARRTRRMRVAVDGEVCVMNLPLRIAVAPRPLRLLLPQAG